MGQNSMTERKEKKILTTNIISKSHKVLFETCIRGLNLLSSFGILEYGTYWGQFRVELYKETIPSYCLWGQIGSVKLVFQSFVPHWYCLPTLKTGLCISKPGPQSWGRVINLSLSYLPCNTYVVQLKPELWSFRCPSSGHLSEHVFEQLCNMLILSISIHTYSENIVIVLLKK